VAAGRNVETLRALGDDDRVLAARLDVTDATEREVAVAAACSSCTSSARRR